MIKSYLTIRKPQSTTGVISDINLSITLGRTAASLGKDEEIARYVAEETSAAIPLLVDRELIRFNLATGPSESRTLAPYFLNSGGTQANSYLAAGFSSSQVISLTQGLARSMYIFELYDSPDTDNQELLSRCFTKGDDVNTFVSTRNSGGTVTDNVPLLQFVTTGGTPTSISPMALPVYFLAKKPSGTVYLQISFFNSVTGHRVKLRRRLTGLSIADNRYVPLTYSSASRTYHLPTGSNLDLEEVPLALTSGKAEAERQKRLALMSATPTRGKFEPLGPPTGINFNSVGSVAQSSGSSSGTTGNGGNTGNGNTGNGGDTGSTAGPIIVVPNTTLGPRFASSSGAFFIDQTTAVTSVGTTSGTLTLGRPVYRPETQTTFLTLLTDGFYPYIVNQVFPPPHVLQVSGGVLTVLDAPNPYRTNIQLVADVHIMPTRIVSAYNACNSTYSSSNAVDVYAKDGQIQTGSPIYTGPGMTSPLTIDGYYKYNDDANGYEAVLRLQNGLITEVSLDCETILADTHDGGPVVVGP